MADGQVHGAPGTFVAWLVFVVVYFVIHACKCLFCCFCVFDSCVNLVVVVGFVSCSFINVVVQFQQCSCAVLVM